VIYLKCSLIVCSHGGGVTWILIGLATITDKISSCKEVPVSLELEKHKSLFDNGSSDILEQRNKPNCSGYRIQVK
jgi:hypothetical protein